MKTIEEIKIELTLKMLSGKLNPLRDIETLPINDELRTFVCSLSPYCAYRYAFSVDKKPSDETRKAACKNPDDAFYYARYVDRCPREDTRESAYKNEHSKRIYQNEVDRLKCS